MFDRFMASTQCITIFIKVYEWTIGYYLIRSNDYYFFMKSRHKSVIAFKKNVAVTCFDIYYT